MLDKFCKSCSKTKFLEEFHKNSNSKDGHCIYCKICNSNKNKEYRKNNPEIAVQRNKKSYDKNHHKYKATRKKWRENNKERVKKQKQEWNKNNIIKINKGRRDRWKEDELYKLAQTIRNLTGYAFRKLKQNKSSKTLDLLGVDFETLKIHIESQFKEGMTWENHGKWHIDHIRPICSDKSKEDLTEICFYKNLCPLWAVDNQRKNGKYKEI